MERTEVHGRRRLLDDFFKVDEAEVSFERADGSMTPPARRLVFERGDSVAAVVVHRESHSLLFTEQFRFPTLGKGSGWLLEVIAGMIDSGETPEAALRREESRGTHFRRDFPTRDDALWRCHLLHRSGQAVWKAPAAALPPAVPAAGARP